MSFRILVTFPKNKPKPSKHLSIRYRHYCKKTQTKTINAKELTIETIGEDKYLKVFDYSKDEVLTSAIKLLWSHWSRCATAACDQGNISVYKPFEVLTDESIASKVTDICKAFAPYVEENVISRVLHALKDAMDNTPCTRLYALLSDPQVWFVYFMGCIAFSQLALNCIDTRQNVGEFNHV